MENWEMEFKKVYPQVTFQVQNYTTGARGVNFKEGFREYKTLGKKEIGILYLEFKSTIYEQKFFAKMIYYWEQYAKANECKMIFVDGGNVSNRYHLFSGVQYQQTSQSLNENIAKGDFFKQVAKGSQKHIYKKTKEVVDFLKKMKESDPLFFYWFRSCVQISEIEIYYKGYTGKILSSFENGVLSFKLSDFSTKYEARKVEDIPDALNGIIEKVNQIMRIRNQFNPPKKFFGEFLAPTISQKEKREFIHQTLMKYYSWEEIEEHAYKSKMNGLSLNKMKEKEFSPCLIEWMGEMFLFNEKEIFHFEEDERKKGLEKYQNMIFELMKTKTEKEFEIKYKKRTV